MPIPLHIILAETALGVAACGALLHVFAALRLRRHLRAVGEHSADTPPLTLWRALKGGVPDLGAKLDALVRGSHRDDQILLGADAGSPQLAACEALRARHPGRQITVVACERDRAANPKISKFIQMTPHARHAHWLLTDSEAVLDDDFIESFRREWHASGADAQTAGYRFTNLRNLPQVLGAAPALLTLWPGLMLAGKIRFTLGACSGVKAADIAALGGWASLGDQLAEDHQLGARLSALGRSVRLSRRVLTLDSDPMTWRELLRHQHRVAVTYRCATPAGALGMPVLHALGFAVLAVAQHPPLWIHAIAVVLVRIAGAAAFSAMLRFPLPALPLAVLLSALLETANWCLAWFPCRVWWAGKWRRVSWRGRLD
jgi:ceramide glucosyltransferase